MTQKNARSRNRPPENVKIKKRRLTGGIQQIADVYREGKELDKLYDRMLNSSEGLPCEEFIVDKNHILSLIEREAKND